MKKYQKSKTIPEVFNEFIKEKEIFGLSEKTIRAYKTDFNAVSRYYNLNNYIDDFTQEDLYNMILCLKSRKKLDGSITNIKDVSINSYLVAMRAFFNWCRKKDYCYIEVPRYKFEVEPKDVYTQEEIKSLIKKPNLKKCSFCEYRNWVIVCFLLNSGCRAGTLRNVLIKDLDFDSDMILFRHTKNKSTQYVPMGKEMKKILLEYLSIRGGKNDDFLFPNQYNQKLSENALKLAIEDYNHSRGVAKASTHLFRHFYAKTYIQNGGDCFRLQKILGHKEIKMTEHYVNLYGADTKKGFEELSPLEVLSAQERKIKMK